MLIVISPAKNLDFQSPVKFKSVTQPLMIDQAKSLVQICKKLSPTDLSDLMGISDKLALLNAERFKEWKLPFDEENSKLAFSLPVETKKPCDFYYFWLVAFFLSFDHRFAFSSALKNRLRDIIDLLIYPEFSNQIGRMHIYIKTANPITLDTIEIIKQELNLFTQDKIEDLFAELNEIEINKAIDAVKLKDSRVEQLAMSVSSYGIIPSDILIPQWTQNVQSKLKDLMSELNNHHSPAVAYTITSKKFRNKQ